MTEATTPTEATTDPVFEAVPGAKEDVTTSLYRAAIGPMCPDFYLPIFSRFETAGKAGLSWNSAASLLTFNWLLFRQLWTPALAYVGTLAAVGLVVFGIGRLVFQMSDTVSLVLALVLGLMAFVVPGLLGNALLHKQCRARMEQALADNPTVAEATSQLQRQASSRRRLLWIALGNLVVLGLAALAYTQISALTTMSAMPQGAAEARQTVSGLATDANSVPAESVAAVAASASASASAAAPAPASEATAEPMMPTVSAPALVASEPVSTAAVTPVESAPQAGEPAAEPAAVHKAVAKPAAPQVSKAAAKAAPQALFYINVGLFSKPENASRVHAQLLEANLPSVMKELKTTKTRQIRVRVGPFATEEKAQAAAQTIKALKYEAGIIQM